MAGLKWLSILAVSVVIIGAIQLAGAAPVDNSLDDLNPLSYEDANRLPGLEREKRKLPEAVFASKNAVLGFVFSGSAKASAFPSAFSSGKKRQSVEATAQLNDIPDDTPEFNRDKVQLDIPDSLFQNSFQTVTGVTKIVGDLILNSSKRFAHFVDLFRPLLGKALSIKGIDVPPPGTKLEVVKNRK